MESQKEPGRLYVAHRRESDGTIQPLDEHLRAVGCYSAINATKLSLAAAGELLGLLHDLGKYSDSFQNYIGSATGLIDQDADDFVDANRLRGTIDHSTAGAQFIWRRLEGAGQKGRIVGQILALCVASHHSGLINCLETHGEDNFTRRIGKSEEGAHHDEAAGRLDPAIAERANELLHHSAMVDDVWRAVEAIAAVEHGSGSLITASFKIGLLARMLFSCLIDADRLDTADFEKPKAARLRHHGEHPAWDILIDRLEAKLCGFENSSPVDALRVEISDHCHAAADRERGCFTLTVPTGGGKTLASLRFALQHTKKWRLQRVIYVIPFTSIIDQNADVVREILEPPGSGIATGSIVLEHHSNITEEKQSWRGKILSENWDAPIIFTTSVQLLEALFGGGTRSARRLHQLAKSIIIFDEVQTIPLRCVHMFNNAVNFLVEHCGSSVVLCTATQPLLHKVSQEKGAVRLSKYSEIMPNTEYLFKKLKRVEILSEPRPGGWSDEDVAHLAAKEIADVGSCLIIVNTRKSALALYHACSELDSRTNIYHLSTSMCPAHRRMILAEIRRRLLDEQPTLCVSTQLIEAGVDVDFGAVIRYIAGLDSVVQAAGRCNRNGKRPLGRVHLINPADERIDRLIDIRVGRDITMRLLSEFEQDPDAFNHDLIGPKAMAKYFEYYFFQRANEMSYPVSADYASRDDTLLRLLAGNDFGTEEYKLQNRTAPPNYLRQAFTVAGDAFKAIDAPTRGLIVEFGAEGKALVSAIHGAPTLEQAIPLVYRAQQYSVNVFPHVFDALLRERAIVEIRESSGIYWLVPQYYSKFFGVSDTPVEPMEMICD